MHDELGRIWKKVVMTSLRFCVDGCLQGLGKTTEKPIQDGQCPGHDLSQPHPKYKSKVLPLYQPSQFLHNPTYIPENVTLPIVRITCPDVQ
jgi:hypothetical protein